MRFHSRVGCRPRLERAVHPFSSRRRLAALARDEQRQAMVCAARLPDATRLSLVFAEMKDPVRRKIERYELTRTIDPNHFFPTVAAAVDAYQRETGIESEPA